MEYPAVSECLWKQASGRYAIHKFHWPFMVSAYYKNSQIRESPHITEYEIHSGIVRLEPDFFEPYFMI
ncbi:hypothetical protein SPRG_16288 [Saprolegnia parasitica CBS 223.65]|uniref:Uncharacterized protein n=1 Tax=Saprolegnia parasitica (strain CBS 223.65) TaxID=695850 RepID=A0A067BJ58_SAPPC|nr:hypothetical protein SPRG_16288 [Saprolegnia parasitica CBS 223.65]KDO18178.1 hypothetical protein SPRG_16288 [Saprolegnia parasitica CBS 223.65]|eukprot:XP_012211114.1 hypothetical protein SPRG_16288 [Saprolegnia parasitica CBS 223.65]